MLKTVSGKGDWSWLRAGNIQDSRVRIRLDNFVFWQGGGALGRNIRNSVPFWRRSFDKRKRCYPSPRFLYHSKNRMVCPLNTNPVRIGIEWAHHTNVVNLLTSLKSKKILFQQRQQMPRSQVAPPCPQLRSGTNRLPYPPGWPTRFQCTPKAANSSPCSTQTILRPS